MLSPFARRLALLVHLVLSISWVGSVVCFLALAITGWIGVAQPSLRANFLAMDLIGLYVVLPLSLATLGSGALLSALTRWGFVRNYWVVIKIALGLFATVALALHQFTAVREAAVLVRAGRWAPDMAKRLESLGFQLVADAGVAVAVLLVAATLAVFKPWGLTPYGRRQESSAVAETPQPAPRGLRAFVGTVVILAIVFVALHLAGLGLGKHG